MEWYKRQRWMFVNDGIEVDIDPNLILQAPTQVLVTHVGSALYGPTYRPSIFDHTARIERNESMTRRPLLTLPYITSLDDLRPWFRDITRDLHRMHCLPLPIDRAYMDDLTLSEFVFHDIPGQAPHTRQTSSHSPSPHLPPSLASEMHSRSTPPTTNPVSDGKMPSEQVSGAAGDVEQTEAQEEVENALSNSASSLSLDSTKSSSHSHKHDE